MKIIQLGEVDSTNLFAKRNLEKLEDKTVVIAKKQTDGRGRLSRRWIDLGEGNIFLSIILKPSQTFASVYSNLTQYLSIVLCKILERHGLEPEIKWPNDVLIDGAKIAGILSETVMQGNCFKGLILGIGINVNSNKEQLSTISDKVATALNIELKKDFVNDTIISQELLDEFFLYYDEFIQKGFEFIKLDYLKRANFIGKDVCVQVFNEQKKGKVKAVNDEGALILQNNNKEFVLTIGDIL